MLCLLTIFPGWVGVERDDPALGEPAQRQVNRFRLLSWGLSLEESSGHTYCVRATGRERPALLLERSRRSVVRGKTPSNYKTVEQGSKIHLFSGM